MTLQERINAMSLEDLRDALRFSLRESNVQRNRAEVWKSRAEVARSAFNEAIAAADHNLAIAKKASNLAKSYHAQLKQARL